MDLARSLAQYAIIIEFSLILLIIFVTYFLMMIYRYRTKKRKAITEKISEYFAKIIPLDAPIKEYEFPKAWQQIDLIVPVLYKFRSLVQDASWEEQRLRVIRSILLPLARKAAKSRDWALRFYAAESFGLVFEKDDDKYIEHLVKDTNPLIRLNALNAAIQYGLEDAINAMITTIAPLTSLTQAMYLQAFDQAPESTRAFVIKRMKSSADHGIKTTCYNILLRYPPVSIDWNIQEDKDSLDMKLKLAAIRYISHVNREAAIPLLLDLLNNEYWPAKTIALYTLSQLRVVEAIPEVRKCLNDSNEWVRLYAHEALTKLEEKHPEIVRTRDVSEEKAVFDIALQVLDTY